MIIIKQMGIILGMLFAGELLSKVFHILIPGNVIGMVLLLGLLSLKVIKLGDVDEIASFMIKYLPIFFIVPSVGIMLYLDLIREKFFVIVVPLIISVVVGLFVTAKVIELLMKRRGE